MFGECLQILPRIQAVDGRRNDKPIGVGVGCRRLDICSHHSTYVNQQSEQAAMATADFRTSAFEPSVPSMVTFFNTPMGR